MLGIARAVRGRTLKLSLPRRAVCDLVHFAKKIPTVPVQRAINVGRVMAARQRSAVKIGWATLFTKAFAIAAESIPELRRAYLQYPRARLYEHPFSVASVAIERECGGEPGVFFANLTRPEGMALPALETLLQWHRQAPLEEAFGFTLKFFRQPGAVRRLLWWYLLNVRGSRKAEFLGTFAVSVYSGLGAESLHPLSPLTAVLNYGVIDAAGDVTLRIVYDHRTLDGATVARALGRIEEVMNGQILCELEDLAIVKVRAA